MVVKQEKLSNLACNLAMSKKSCIDEIFEKNYGYHSVQLEVKTKRYQVDISRSKQSVQN